MWLCAYIALTTKAIFIGDGGGYEGEWESCFQNSEDGCRKQESLKGI